MYNPLYLAIKLTKIDLIEVVKSATSTHIDIFRVIAISFFYNFKAAKSTVKVMGRLMNHVII
jgi:hypothetical protein